MTLFFVYSLITVATFYATKRGLKRLDQKIAAVSTASVEAAVSTASVEAAVPYRTAEKPGLSDDESLPIQPSCPKCREKGRAYFEVVYDAETDRLRVRCGRAAAGGGVYNGCGAKWIELPGDSK